MEHGKTIRIAVLGSTRGTDMQAIIDAQQAGNLPGAELVFVLSNKPDAFILERAKQAGIESRCIPSKGKSREEFDQLVLEALRDHAIDLILLIGFMRILSPVIVDKFPNRIMNIHPSLLPKYPGGMDLNVHEEVLKNGDKITGCTLHYVTNNLDAGPIIMQAEVPVDTNDTPETLKEKVQAAEQRVILKSIAEFVNKQAV